MARPKSDPIERFLKKVKHVESGCHEWQAQIKRDGYGRFSFNGKSTPAHRVAYGLFVSPPGKLCVLHKCDNRICVNPAHLFLGTKAENVADMDQKDRRGTKSKLTYKQVAEIKSLLADRYSQIEIARKYGVCQSVISRIKLGQTSKFKQ